MLQQEYETQLAAGNRPGFGRGGEPDGSICGAAGVCGYFVADADTECGQQGTARISAGEKRGAEQRHDGRRSERKAGAANTRRNKGVSANRLYGKLAGPEGTSGLRDVYGRRLAAGLCGYKQDFCQKGAVSQQVADVPSGKPGEAAAGI